MAFCKVNGVVVPVQVNEAEDQPELVEDSNRMEDASLFVDRRAEKGKWRCSTILQTGAYASAFRKLIHGEGHYFSFDSNLYSSRGLPPTGSVTGVTIGSSTPSPWLGAGRVKITNGNTLTYSLGTGLLGLTVAVAVNVNAAGWNHFFKDDTGAVFTNGVAGGLAGTITITLSTGTVQLSTAGLFDYGYDELVIFPYRLPSDWPGQMYDFQNPASGNTQFGKCRQVKLSGDIVDDQTTRSVIGRVTSAKVKHTKVAGAKMPKRSLDVEFEEV